MVVIINADDFGINEQINRAIIQSFERGLCSSTTLMANMPGFEEACELSHENKLLNHIGMHLVLTEGYPLTEKIKYFHKFCDKEGRFCLSRTRPIFTLEASEKQAVAEEIRAQIRRCRVYGIPITHIDSHHHIHTEWAIATLLIHIAREEHIPYIRISRNCGPNLDFPKRLYKYILNHRLRLAGFARTQYFGSVDDYLFLKRQVSSSNAIKSFEVMIHPRLNDKQVLVDGTNGKSLEEVIKGIDSYEDAISFSGIKYGMSHSW